MSPRKLLSGGIDSTAIASFLASQRSVKTFSVGFEGEQNENVVARQIAEALGTNHFEELISAQHF